jgi:two-component system, response regulator
LLGDNTPISTTQTVLVIEDCELEAKMLERGLVATFSRTEIIHTQSTTQAEKYLFSDAELAGGDQPNPHIIFLDVRIPPAGGIALLQRLKADSRTKAIPVIMLSSQMRQEDVQDLYLAGANSFLDKPVDFQDFVDLVANAARYWLDLNLSAGPRRPLVGTSRLER